MKNVVGCVGSLIIKENILKIFNRLISSLFGLFGYEKIKKSGRPKYGGKYGDVHKSICVPNINTTTEVYGD